MPIEGSRRRAIGAFLGIEPDEESGPQVLHDPPPPVREFRRLRRVREEELVPDISGNMVQVEQKSSRMEESDEDIPDGALAALLQEHHAAVVAFEAQQAAEQSEAKKQRVFYSHMLSRDTRDREKRTLHARQQLVGGGIRPEFVPTGRQVWRRNSDYRRQAAALEALQVEAVEQFLAERQGPRDGVFTLREFATLPTTQNGRELLVPLTSNYLLDLARELSGPDRPHVLLVADGMHNVGREQLKLLSVGVLQMKFVGPLWGPTAVPLVFALCFEETGTAVTRMLDMLLHLVPGLGAKVAHFYTDGGRPFRAAFEHHFPQASPHRCLQHLKKNIAQHVQKTRSRTSSWFLRAWMDITACIPSDVLFQAVWGIIRQMLAGHGDNTLNEYMGHILDLAPQWRCSFVHTRPGYSTYASNSQESLWQVLRGGGVKGPYNLLGIFEALEGLARLWEQNGRFRVGHVVGDRVSGDLFLSPQGLKRRPQVLLTGEGWKGPANFREFDEGQHAGPQAFDAEGQRRRAPQQHHPRRRQFRRQVVERMLEVDALTPFALEIIPPASSAGEDVPPHPWCALGRRWIIPKVSGTHYDEDLMQLWHELMFATDPAAVQAGLQHEHFQQQGSLDMVSVQRFLGRYTCVEDVHGTGVIDWHFDFQKHGCSEHSIFMEVKLNRYTPDFIETRSARTLLHQRARDMARQRRAQAKPKAKPRAKAKAPPVAGPAEDHGSAGDLIEDPDGSLLDHEEWESVSHPSQDSLDYLFEPGLPPSSARD